MNQYVLDNNKLEIIKKAIKEGGRDKLHVLADFDRTLTYGMVNGKKTPSIISELRNGNYLTEEYAKQAHEFFNKYHAIEVDPDVPINEKKEKMLEWWNVHNKLLVESGVSKNDLEQVVENGSIRFREGVKEFITLLKNNNIPLVIISASGCGDIIQMYCRHHGVDYENVHYITNQFEWNEKGIAIAAKEPVIHCMNKDETVLESIPQVYGKVKNRKNILLLGDSIGDLGMAEGSEYDNLVSVGFLNSDEEKLLDIYKKKFNVVLTGDGTFKPVNTLIGDLV